jgi:hypothetical protein
VIVPKVSYVLTKQSLQVITMVFIHSATALLKMNANVELFHLQRMLVPKVNIVWQGHGLVPIVLLELINPKLARN